MTPPLLLAVAIASGCAGSPAPSGSPRSAPPRALELRPWTPPPGQRCSVDTLAVPVLEELVDTAAATASMGAAAGHRGGLLLHVSSDTVEAGVDFWRMETTLDPELADRVEDALRAADRPDAPRTTGRLLVRLDGEGGVAYRIGGAQGCRPHLINSGEVSAYLTRASRGLGSRGTVTVRMRVLADGSVGRVEIERSSGSGYVDEISAGIASRAVFYPALIDRIPVPFGSRWISPSAEPTLSPGRDAGRLPLPRSSAYSFASAPISYPAGGSAPRRCSTK